AYGVGRVGLVQTEKFWMVLLGFGSRHALPDAVVDIVQVVQDAQIRNTALVGDDLPRCDGPSKRTDVDGCDALSGQLAGGVDRVLIALGVERNIAPTAVSVLHVHRRR